MRFRLAAHHALLRRVSFTVDCLPIFILHFSLVGGIKRPRGLSKKRTISVLPTSSRVEHFSRACLYSAQRFSLLHTRQRMHGGELINEPLLPDNTGIPLWYLLAPRSLHVMF